MEPQTVIEPIEGGAEDNKGRWRVRVLRAGWSQNGRFYPPEPLKRAVQLFEGARVYVKSDREHLQGGGKDFRNLVGRIVEAEYAESEGVGEIRGVLELIQPSGDIGTKLREAWSRGMGDLFGLSIDALGQEKRGRMSGKPARILSAIQKVQSVDLVMDPAAGGRFINLIESKGANAMENLTTQQITQIVEACGLPAPAKKKLIAAHSEPSEVTEAELKEAIKEELDYLSSMSDQGLVRGVGGHSVQLIEGRDEKVASMLDSFFDPKDRSITSIREAYLNITGDRAFSGMIRNCDQSLLRESLGSASLGEVLGDAIHRRLIKEYENETVYDVWRMFANVVPVSDFRTQERTRFGGYGDLPIVAESEPYIGMNSPTDEKATYAVQKRGGTEDLTLEMITNDDVGAVTQIPKKLTRAAKRTLSKFVLDFIRTNPAIYDGLPLFHVTHGNLGAAALDAAAVAAARLAMKAQTELNTTEKLGIGPRYLWVPDELEETAVNLFRRSTENDKTFLQSLSLEVIPVWCWDDTSDWAATADPDDIPTLELGFLGGQEEPELFVQDDPRSGAMFSHDKLTYKIRHIYGGTVTDYRGAYKAVVA